WMLISSALVFQMVPAMCLFYSGATSRLSSLKLFRLPLITAAVVGFQWYLFGYTLAFTPAVTPNPLPGPSWYGGDPRGAALHDTVARPVGSAGPRIPEIVFELYESMFASFTAALVCGGAIRDDPQNKFPASDIPAGRFLIFISLWSLLVYNPVARWTWHWAGWSNQLGVMDFAGGTAVHITSGTTVLAFYIFHAIQTGPAAADRAPHNVNNIVLGTALLWMGWFGFNGGSALGGNLRAASACVATHVAACAGGTSMLLLDARNPSVTHFCDGVVIALVAVTPGAGFVPVWSAGVFGVVSAVAVFFFKWFTAKWLYDEPLYVFAIHAGGGMVGMILTGAFAE
ncbi:ammonium transporter AmtB-like domain-containing protein, partial [Coniochaeta sp. 2T2.1]